MKRPGLSPENEVTFKTSFSHLWEFVRSNTSERLTVKGNGVTSIVFEGCNFNAKPNERITVYITKGSKHDTAGKKK